MKSIFTHALVTLLLLNVICSSLILASGPSGGIDEAAPTKPDEELMSNTLASPLFLDNDSVIENATEITDAMFFNKTIQDNLSGFWGVTGNDFVDYYKIRLDNKAEAAGLNADKLILSFNTTSTYNISLYFYDPDLHLLATTETAGAFGTGSIMLAAQSTGYHYIKLVVNPLEGDAVYNLTYQLITETNILLDNNNDFSNSTKMNFSITNMGAWEKKEFNKAFSLNQYQDLHDFYNLTINASENMTIALTVPSGSTYGIGLFNGTNASWVLASKRFFGGQDSINNTPIYFDINRSGEYFLRIFSVYENPNLDGGSGSYSLSVLIKPQNNPPIVRQEALSTLLLGEDDPPAIIYSNDTIFFDPDIENTRDNLTFYILNGTTWDLSYSSENLTVSITGNGTINISSQPDMNTTGENLTFRAVDWLGWNVTHNITVRVDPTNDAPVILLINGRDVKSDHITFTNNGSETMGAWEDQTFSLTVVAFDIDYDKLEFDYNSGTVPFETSIGYNDPNIMNFSFTPTHELVGFVNINISINETDNATIPGDFVLVNITVNNTNDAPWLETVNGVSVTPGEIIEFLGPEGVFAGGSLNFTVTANDQDLQYGDNLTFNSTNITLIKRGILEITQIDSKSSRITFTPEELDVGIKLINITAQDLEGVSSFIILEIEVKAPKTKYTLTETDCEKEYVDPEENDDYTFYELVYQREYSPISYHMMAYTAKGDMPGVDIVKLSSNKVGDYMNVSVTFRDSIPINTTIKVFYVYPETDARTNFETQLDNSSKVLPEPYIPPESSYILSFSYDDPLQPDAGNPVNIAPNILNFTIHLGTLENIYGFTHGMAYGLFTQAYKKGSNDYNYFTYDSVGEIAMQAPEDEVSHLLTFEECDFRKTDDTDDVYGYNIKFKSQDRTAGLTVEKTERGGHPEIDIVMVRSRRNGFYLDVTLTLGGAISNDSQVSYTVYLVSFNHTERGIHLDPLNITDTNYPQSYIPPKEYYYIRGKYSNGKTIMADKTAVGNNRITFSFHLVQLQHPELGNIHHNSNFGIFATALREMNATSILEYGFYYDANGTGAQFAPTAIIELTEEEKDDEVPFLFILGQIGGIPILLLIILAIIVICIIGGYAGYLRSKYGKEVEVDVPAVPAVPSARGTSSPKYGVYPGMIRDERYYKTLYRDEPGPSLDAVEEFGLDYGAGGLPEQHMGYDVLPDEEELPGIGPTGARLLEPAISPEIPGQIPPDEPPVVPSPEELPEDEETDLLGDIHLPEDEIEPELEEGVDEWAEDEEEPVEDEEPVTDEEPVEEGEEEPEEEEIIEEEEEPAEEEEELDFEIEEGQGLEEDEFSEEEEPVEDEEPVTDEEPVEEGEEEPVEEVEPVSEEEPVTEEEPVEEGEDEPEEEEPAEEPEELKEPETEEEEVEEEFEADEGEEEFEADEDEEAEETEEDDDLEDIEIPEDEEEEEFVPDEE